MSLTSVFRKTELTKEEAIKRAEQFIVDNGYTNLPANNSKLSFELFDHYESNTDSIIKGRHNTLHQKAFCISEDGEEWHVGFLSISVDPSKIDPAEKMKNLAGRAVIVLKKGGGIRMAHKDPLFSKFQRL